MIDSSQNRTRSARVSLDLACFELADQTYAVPIGRVREILTTPRLTPLPDAPDVIEIRRTWQFDTAVRLY